MSHYVKEEVVFEEVLNFDSITDQENQNEDLNDLRLEKYPKRSSIKEHSETNRQTQQTSVEKFSCEKCGKEFRKASYLRLHVARHSYKRNFKCHQCDKAFKTKPELGVHRNNVHATGKPFRCVSQGCSQRFPTTAALKRHMSTAHVKNKSEFNCEKCGKTFSTPRIFKEHAATHSDVRKYGCDQCDLKFKTKRNLAGHKNNVHATGKPFQCEVCSMAFPSSHYLKRHRKVHDKTKYGRFRCEMCGKNYLSPSTFKNHLAGHGDEKKFKCDRCGKGYRNQFSLTLHESNAHATEHPFRCEECPKKFSTSALLNLHFRNHKEKSHQCDQCPKRYSWKTSLDDHKASAHDVGGAFSCDVCGKKFALRTRFKRHTFTHETETNFSCDWCDNTFKKVAHLIMHKRYAHATGKPLNRDENKPHKCEFCPKSYIKPSLLAKHKLNFHNNGDKFSCGVCGNRFISLIHFQRHLVSHSTERNFNCDRCYKKYKRQEDLCKHVKSAHATGGMKRNGKGADVVAEVKVEPVLIYDSEKKQHFSNLGAAVKDEPEEFESVLVKREPREVEESGF